MHVNRGGKKVVLNKTDLAKLFLTSEKKLMKVVKIKLSSTLSNRLNSYTCIRSLDSPGIRDMLTPCPIQCVTLLKTLRTSDISVQMTF